MSDLKPCPFCGSAAEYELVAGYAPQVYCTGENCSVYIRDIGGACLDGVEERWNTRWIDNVDDK